MNLKVDIITYQRDTWFSKKIWVAMCQTKLPLDIPMIYAETENEAFEKMKDKIQVIVEWLEKRNAATRTLEITIGNNGNRISTHWSGPALAEKWKRDRAA
jgi:hypothetical protein